MSTYSLTLTVFGHELAQLSASFDLEEYFVIVLKLGFGLTWDLTLRWIVSSLVLVILICFLNSGIIKMVQTTSYSCFFPLILAKNLNIIT